MFCPRCGAQSAENLKFCRNCGADLEVVSAALTGSLVPAGRKKSKKDEEIERTNDPDKLWNIFITHTLTGLAFIAIAIFLTITGTIGGNVWGFWLLIPGAGSLGRGIASYLRAKRIERRRAEYNSLAFGANNPPLFQNQSTPVLTPQSIEFVNPYAPPALNTDELIVPPSSVTEGTTRHLQMNAEGETINLPNQK